jgi:thymidylate kinase
MNAESYPGLVAISGRTRAGKTTLAHALAADLGWPRASFSEYVRAVARDRGLEQSRRALQDLGAELVATLAPGEFAMGALTNAGLRPRDAPFAIEGVRYVSTLEGLREVAAPLPVALIYLTVSDAERDRRLAAEGVAVAEGRRWEEHPTEHDVLHRLEAVADLVVDADAPADLVAKTVERWLRER